MAAFIGYENEMEVKTTMEEVQAQLQQCAPQEFARLLADPEKKKRFSESTKAIALEQFKISKEFRHQPGEASILSKYLSQDRLEMIQNGFSYETFCMNIEKKKDGEFWVDLTRAGKIIEPATEVKGPSDINEARLKQGASILVECVQLFKSVAGVLNAFPSPKATDKAIDETVKAIKSSSKLQKALDAFVDAWNKAGSSAYQKAKAIFYLMKDSYAASILCTIIKAICSDMAWYDWLLTAAKVIAMIVAAVATDGVALIAEISLVVLSAVDFARKIVNMYQLESIKGTMQ